MKDNDDESTIKLQSLPSWRFGGIATRPDAIVPICKHILAVVLGKAAPGLFENAMVMVDVSREEIAARAAGWGEK